jgi:hypothetical protein
LHPSDFKALQPLKIQTRVSVSGHAFGGKCVLNMAGKNNNHRPSPFTVRLTDEERTELEHRAERAGLSLGGYFKSAAFNTPPPAQSRRPPVDRAELAKLLAAIGRIGNNVNQLARVANAGSWPEAKDLSQACSDIRWIRKALMKALGKDTDPTPRGPGP